MTIKYFSKRLPLFLSFTLLLFLTACGGGDGGGQPQKVTATFALQGNAATTVGAVDLDVVLPSGFALETDSSNQPTASALTFLVTGATFVPNYTPETATANGAIKAGIIKSDGFAGNSSLLQISRIYAAGAILPTADDFMVTVVVSDLNGVALTGISGQSSVSSQPVP
jgi:hypothetical protein